MRKQIIGGPSLDFSRYEKVNQSFIGEAEKKLVKPIIGYDTKYYISMQLVEIFIMVPIQYTNPIPVTDFSRIDILFKYQRENLFVFLLNNIIITVHRVWSHLDFLTRTTR